MTPPPTTVTLTGTGVPHPAPGRAGAGTLVRHGDIALQFDAGRGTTLRLTEAGAPPTALTAVFLTHIHSDHLVGLADVAMTHWILQQIRRTATLQIVCAEGLCERFAGEMFAPYAGCDVLVHEACRATALHDAVKGTNIEKIFSYHADTVALGGLAQRAGVRHLLLTHLIPAPSTPEQEAAFEQDVRDGGYTGTVTVGRDLTSVTIER